MKVWSVENTTLIGGYHVFDIDEGILSSRLLQQL